jgi:hypothetical protein
MRALQPPAHALWHRCTAMNPTPHVSPLPAAAQMIAAGKVADTELVAAVQASGNSWLWAWLGGIPPDSKEVCVAAKQGH